MSSNLGMKPIFRTNDKRNMKGYKTRPARQKYCRICGQPFNGSGHICDSCRTFIKSRQTEERKVQDELRRP